MQTHLQRIQSPALWSSPLNLISGVGMGAAFKEGCNSIKSCKRHGKQTNLSVQANNRL